MSNLLVEENSLEKTEDSDKGIEVVNHPISESSISLDVNRIGTAGLEKVGTLELSDFVFATPIREDIAHRVVVWERACSRSGNVCVKNRGELTYSRRKLRPQKHTGKARLGDAGSPHLRKGGKSHAPKPKVYAFQLPKRVVRHGFRIVLSSRFSAGTIFVLEEVTGVQEEIRYSIKGNYLADALIVDLSIPDVVKDISFEKNKISFCSLSDLKLTEILKRKNFVISSAALEILNRYLSHDNIKQNHSDILKLRIENKKIENYLKESIRTSKKFVPRYVLYKGTGRIVYSKRYDLKKKLPIRKYRHWKRR